MVLGPNEDVFRWYSCHTFLNNLTQGQIRQKALQQGIRIDTKPSRTQEFADSGPWLIIHCTGRLLRTGSDRPLKRSTTQKQPLQIPSSGILFERLKGTLPISKWRFVFIIERNYAYSHGA
jgi:hypothetical protein